MEPVTCPGCGNTLEAGAKFCPYCGTAFEAGATLGPDDSIPADELLAATLTPDSISPPITVDQPSRHEKDIRNKSGFRWWFLLIPAISIIGTFFLINSSHTNIVNAFKDTKDAAGWQFTTYSAQSFARATNGLVIYDGIYTYKESYPDVTVTINATIRTDTAIEQNGYLCIWLRYNPGMRKGYCFIIKPVTKTAHLGIAGDPNPQSVDLAQLIPDFNPYQAHTYTASARGENLQLAIDGRQVANLYDVGLIKGQVALEARGLSAAITRAEITPGR
jgi:hypothetical protein